MNFNLQTTLLIGSTLTFIFIFLVTKKVNMNVRYSIVWIIWGLIILILSLFPSIIDNLSMFFGIALPTNMLFLIFIFLLYIMSFYLFIKTSELNDKIKSLTYSIAILRKEVADNKRKNT